MRIKILGRILVLQSFLVRLVLQYLPRREREGDVQRETDRQADNQTDRDRETEATTERDRDTQRDRDTERKTDRQRHTQRHVRVCVGGGGVRACVRACVRVSTPSLGTTLHLHTEHNFVNSECI